MKNKLIDAIIVIIMAATAVGASVAIYQAETSSVQEAPQVGGYPAPEYGYPIATPNNDITLPGYPVMPTPYKVPTGQPIPPNYTPAQKMTPTDIVQ